MMIDKLMVSYHRHPVVSNEGFLFEAKTLFYTVSQHTWCEGVGACTGNVWSQLV